MLSQYSGRIGGPWQEKGSGRVAQYLEKVVYLRNRVAHAGYMPSHAEVNQAFSAMVDIELFVGDRLTASGVLNRFPRTAHRWCGPRGIDRRKAWTGKLRATVNDKTEPDWNLAFDSWRGHFLRERGSGPAPGETKEELSLLSELLPDGSERFLLVDFAARHVAVVPALAAPITQSQRDALNALHATLREQQVERAIRTKFAVDFANTPLPAALAWEPDHTYLPERSYKLPSHT